MEEGGESEERKWREGKGTRAEERRGEERREVRTLDLKSQLTIVYAGSA